MDVEGNETLDKSVSTVATKYTKTKQNAQHMGNSATNVLNTIILLNYANQ